MNIRRNGPLGWVVCVLVAMTLAVAGASATPAEGKPKKRPDLIVKSGAFSRPGVGEVEFVVGHGETAEYVWTQRTQNRGKAVAPRSKTGVQILVDARHVISPRDARVNVPRLAPGKSHATRDRFEVFWDHTWDYGTYPTRICADVTRKVRESKEGKNCRTTHNIYVIPFGLTGTISGEAVQPLVYPGVTLSWSSRQASRSNSTRTHSRSADEGIIGYAFRDPVPDVPDLQYTISGTNSLDGCAWQGAGGYEPATEFHTVELIFSRPSGRFHAQILVDRASPSSPSPRPSPVPAAVTDVQVTPAHWGRASYWFDTGAFTRFRDPGLSQLNGAYTDTNATYHWNLSPFDLQP